MKLFSKQLSGPKIEAFLKIFPFLKEMFGEKEFEVEEAIRRINAKPELGVWCHTTLRKRKKWAEAVEQGLTTLDLQNACHCFAGRDESSVIDLDTGEPYKLLEKVTSGNLTYRILGSPEPSSRSEDEVVEPSEKALFGQGVTWTYAKLLRTRTDLRSGRGSSQSEVKPCRIRDFAIKNFKAFGDVQAFPIKPLTLLFGPNSGGKSSLIHSLLLANHAHKGGSLDAHYTDIGGRGLDLGGFRQYVHRRDFTRVVVWSATLPLQALGESIMRQWQGEDLTIELEIGVGASEATRLTKFPHPETGELEDVQLPDPEGGYEVGHDPEIVGCSLRLDGRTLLRYDRPDSTKFDYSEGRDKREAEMVVEYGQYRNLLRLSYINTLHPSIQALHDAVVDMSTLTELTDGDKEAINQAIRNAAGQVVLSVSEFLPDPKLPKSLESISPQALSIPVSRGKRQDDLTGPLRLFFPKSLAGLFSSLRQVLSHDLLSMQYLGPIRSYPPRYFSLMKERDADWDAGGLAAWHKLIGSQMLQLKINEWLSGPGKLDTNYRIGTDDLLSSRHIEQELPGRIREECADLIERLARNTAEGGGSGSWPIGIEVWEWFNSFNDTDRRSRIEELVERYGDANGMVLGWYLQHLDGIGDTLPYLELLDEKTGTLVSHRDVGVGISQFLPVLVNALGLLDSIVLIEGPEQHLHPKLQADLTDVFIESANTLGNTFILETHSEHMALRILRRIRETYEGKHSDDDLALTSDQVAMIYVEPTSEGSVLHHMKITPDGDFEERWPQGFFDERIREFE